MAVEFGLLISGAYLLGAVPAAYLVAKWSRGIDLRQYGSGNVGASNLWRSTSRRLALSVVIFDLGKGASMVWAAQLVGLDVAQQVTVGLAAVIGHNWSVFLRFGGGRGVLTTMGIALILPVMNGLVPWGVIISLAMVAIGWFLLHNIPLGVGSAVAALPLVSWAFGEPLPLTLGFLVMSLIVVIRRLTAPRTSVTASVTPGQLLLNRLLFDRDIRDREAWINRVPLQTSSAKQPLKQQEKQGKG